MGGKAGDGVTKKKSPLSEADRLFSLWVRDRDGCCTRCGRSGTLQCHHLISRTYRKVRFDPRNGHAVCKPCHVFLTHRPLENDEFAIALVGEETWAELRAIARDTSYKVDLKEVLADLRKKVAA